VFDDGARLAAVAVGGGAPVPIGDLPTSVVVSGRTVFMWSSDHRLDVWTRGGGLRRALAAGSTNARADGARILYTCGERPARDSFERDVCGADADGSHPQPRPLLTVPSCHPNYPDPVFEFAAGLAFVRCGDDLWWFDAAWTRRGPAADAHGWGEHLSGYMPPWTDRAGTALAVPSRSKHWTLVHLDGSGTFEGAAANVFEALLSLDGTSVYALGDDGVITRAAASPGAPGAVVFTPEAGDRPDAWTPSPDRAFALVSRTPGWPWLVGLSAPVPARTLEPCWSLVTTAVFTRDSRYLVSVRCPTEEGPVVTDAEGREVRDTRVAIAALPLSPGATETVVAEWRHRPAPRLLPAAGSAVVLLDFPRDERSPPGTPPPSLRVVDLAAPAPVRTLANAVAGAELSPDGEEVAFTLEGDGLYAARVR
jgi:hypothetical protein